VTPSLPVAIVEERLPSILSRALATRLRCTSAELLSPLFTALQASTRSALAEPIDLLMALKFCPLGLVILLLDVSLVVLLGLGRPCMVRLDELAAPLPPALAVLLDISVVEDEDCRIPLLCDGWHMFCNGDVLLSLLLPAVVVFAAFVVLMLVLFVWEDDV
jgi:hypothetical protein